MNKNIGKIISTGSMLSILLAFAAIHNASAARVDGSFSGQGSATATANANSSDNGNAGAASKINTAASGNASAGADEGALRDSAQRNGSTMLKAGSSVANSTVAGARQSGRAVAQQGGRAAESVTVNGDASALVNGAATVETGDGIAIDLNSVTNSAAGIAVRPGNADGSADVIAGEVSRTSTGIKGNAVALAGASESSARNLAESARGSVNASGNLAAEISAVADIQQDVTSRAQSAVEEAVSETQATVTATVETAISTAAEVTADLAADVQSETSATLEEAQNFSESVNAEAMGDLDLAGSGAVGL